ncbi:MAG: adhesin [Gemmatimonadales bacterium]|jgi:DNA-binding transcriptional regulator YiaG
MSPLELRDGLQVLGLSQVQLARDLHVTDRAVRYWVAGKHRVPAHVVRIVKQGLERGYYLPPAESPAA